jgi:tetratricopeptide (TPR) repeat protein
MTTLKFITTFLLITLYSCGQKSAKYKVDSVAVELNNKAMTLVTFIDNADSSKKAISLLDKATTIDSNYFLGHCNKLMFFNQLKQFDKAVLTVNKLIRLRPFAHDLYLTGGILYERIGDTVSSKTYFTKSLTICSTVLDTMSVTNSDYEMLMGNKATNLIMLDNQQKANEILRKLYDKQTDEELKKNTLLMMNKSKKQLLELWASDQYSH